MQGEIGTWHSPVFLVLRSTRRLSVCLVRMQILMLEREGITDETFTDAFPLSWSSTSAEGEVILLRPNGGDLLVSWREREEYVLTTLAFRLAEGRLQVESMLHA